MTPIIRSLLETDLYKFTMWQTLLHRHPEVQATYRFVCRNETAYPLAVLRDAVARELEALYTMRFEEDELAYLRGLRFIKGDFVDFLSIFRFQPRFIKVTAEGDTLSIVAHGPQVHVMGFEIFVLAIVNELYFRHLEDHAGIHVVKGPDGFPVEGRTRLTAKIVMLKASTKEARRTNPFVFFDFGLRRRYSGPWHEEVVSTFVNEAPLLFTGTSNVWFAKKYGLVAIGTMAHEYLQTYQALGVQLRQFQNAALEDWVQEFRGDLGIALTDTVGMDAFLADFDLYLAKLFDGLRHDSGDPLVWGEKALAHYDHMRINAQTKRLVFSDGLDIPTALTLYRHFADRVQTGFGIGTNLSNDVGVKPLNIVMKLVEANGQPVAKLSDSPGKTLCDDATFLAYLRQVFKHPA
ncbi:MAG: nicotinate phosphoribosyltransferase [Burkholderiales bacterium]